VGIFSQFRPKAINTEMERMIREHFGGGSTSSGVAVNSDTAMRQMTVNNCVRVLFNCVSQMPCQLMEEVDDIKSKAKKHPLYKVIGKRPNRWMTAPQIWGMAIVHVSLRGNFYAFKTKIRNEVRELLPIHPDCVTQIVQNEDWSLTYKIATAGKGIQDYSQDQIFHIRGLSLDGYTGLNPIEYARECIGLGLAGEKFLSNYFGKGMHPGAIMTTPFALNAKDYLNQLAAFKEKYAGINQSRDVMLLEKDMTITFPEIKLVDQQFLEEMKMTESQICGMYGVPLMLVQAGDNPETYASASEFKRTFVDMTLAPIAVNFETSIDRDCLTEAEQDRYYTKFNMGALLRGNMTERFAAYAVGITNKFMNRNEARRLEDWNDCEGGDIFENPNTSSMKDQKGGDNKGGNKDES